MQPIPDLSALKDAPHSSYLEPGKDALIDSAWYADAAIAPLVVSGGAGQHNDAPLLFKESNDRPP
jgi:hypothetical protein